MRPRFRNVVPFGSIVGSLALIAALAPASPAGAAPAVTDFPTVYYGASYYWEYMPRERLEDDVKLMEAAGFTFARVGESTWGVLEPEDGRFDFEWLARVIDRLHRSGIKVILGTPTYSIPAWLYAKHPEIQVKPLNAPRYTYGIRQMTDLTHPVYRKYAERIIRALVERFRDHPAVMGYQLDNETHPAGTSDGPVQAAFRERLRAKFGTPEALNRAWLLNYWGQRVNAFDEVPPRDGALNPGYKLEWERFQQDIAADFLDWQAGIVGALKRPGQFVTHDFVGGFPSDVDPFAIARRSLDVPAVNIYFTPQDRMSADDLFLSGDLHRSVKGGSYLVTETNAQTTGWSSENQLPPYDGQLRLAALAMAANGANLVGYWHWHSLHNGQETYWKGVLGHDLEPGRVYAEAARTGADLRRVGPELAGLRTENRAAILYSLDSRLGLSFMPFDAKVDYMTILAQMYKALGSLNVETDVLSPLDPSFERYSAVLVPPLYVADDALLRKLSDYVRGGGHVLMAFKSGFCDENSTVRAVRAPGPLREACGFSYQEFSTLAAPLPLRGDPFGAGADNRVSAWAEFLVPETAQPLAFYDHPFFGRYPAVTRNRFGRGTLTYEGTALSDALQAKVVASALEDAGIDLADAGLPAGVRVRRGRLRSGAAFAGFFNFGGVPRELVYRGGAGRDLLTGRAVGPGDRVTLAPWDALLLREDAIR